MANAENNIKVNKGDSSSRETAHVHHPQVLPDEKQEETYSGGSSIFQSGERQPIIRSDFCSFGYRMKYLWIDQDNFSFSK